MEEEHELTQLNPSDNNNGDNEEEEKLENVAELKKELIEIDNSIYTRILNAMQMLIMSSSSIYLAVALNKFLFSWTTQSSSKSHSTIVNIFVLFFTIIGLSSAINKLNNLLRWVSNNPNKLWILSNVCGHIIAFMAKGVAVSIAEMCEITKSGIVLTVLYAIFLIFLAIVVLECKKQTLEKEQKRIDRKNNRRRKCCCGVCKSNKEMRKWSMRRILRYVVASSESIMEGMAILVAFVLNSLVIMLYDPHHAFAEHNPCAVVEKKDHQINMEGNKTITGGSNNADHVVNDPGHSSDELDKGDLDSMFILTIVGILSCFVIVPFGRLQLQKCRGKLPSGGTASQVSILFDNGLIFFYAWAFLSIIELEIKVYSILYSKNESSSFDVMVGNWIEFLLFAVFSVLVLVRTLSAKKTKQHWYNALLISANEKLFCIIVGVKFEEAIVCTFLDGGYTEEANVPYLNEYLSFAFFVLGIIIFIICVKYFGKSMVRKMEVEIDEMLEELNHKSSSTISNTEDDNINEDDDNNNNSSENNKDQTDYYITLSRSFANEEEFSSIDYSNVELQRTSGDNSANSNREIVVEDGESFSYREL